MLSCSFLEWNEQSSIGLKRFGNSPLPDRTSPRRPSDIHLDEGRRHVRMRTHEIIQGDLL